MIGKTGKKISLVKLTAFVVLLDVFLAVLIFLPSGIDGKIAAAIHGIKSLTDKASGIKDFEKKSKLSLAGNPNEVGAVVENEQGKVLGESDSQSEAGMPSSDTGSSQTATYYVTKKITAGEILSALDHDLTYEQIAQRGVRRWNMNVGSVNSKKIVDYSIQSRDLDTDSVYSRAIEDHSIQSRDLQDNIRIRGYFTVEKTAYLHGDVEITGDISAATGTIVSLDGTTLTYDTANLTTANISTIDLGTNTITDGNFTGNWNFNSGNLSGLGNLLPALDDTYDLGSNALRWRNIYLGGETLHIGTSTSDEYAIEYNTSLNYLGFNANGSGNPEIVFDSSGNLGIGTTSPGYTLDVAGDINIFDSGEIRIGGTQVLSKGIGSLTENLIVGNGGGNIMAGGTNNTAVGITALDANTTGSRNTAVGATALLSNTTGIINTAVGRAALTTNVDGSSNTAFGESSLRFNVSGSNNAAVGRGALYFATGSNNTALGNDAGYGNLTGSGNVFLGQGAGRYEMGSNKLYIANSTTTSLIYGDFSTGMVGIGGTAASTGPYIYAAGGNVGIGTTNPTGKLQIVGGDTLLGTGTFNNPSASDDLYVTGNVEIDGTLYYAAVGYGGSIIPTLDDTFDLGSDAFRWKDLWLGGETLHIGTVDADEGKISYITGNNVLNFQSSGNIALQSASGNVGIGTTNPGAPLEAVGSSANSVLMLYQNAAASTSNAAGIGFYVNRTTSGKTRAAYLEGQLTNIGDATYTGVLKFFTNNAGSIAERMRIDNLGNVGIGTTNPGAKLEVDGLVHILNGYGSSSGLTISSGNANPAYNTHRLYMYYDSATPTEFVMGSYNAVGGVRLPIHIQGNFHVTDGNVGIGTTSPVAGPLQLYGNASGGETRLVVSQKDSAATGYATVVLDAGSANLFMRRYGASSAGTIAGISNADLALVWTTSAANLLIGTQSASPFIFATSDAERMRITSGGNVGIGTTAAGAKLHIIGAGGVIGYIESTNLSDTPLFEVKSSNRGVDLGVFGQTSGGIFQDQAILLSNGSTGALNLRVDNASGYFRIFTGGDTADKERLRITSDGNVGIGTTSPTTRLQVIAPASGAPISAYSDSIGRGIRLYSSDFVSSSVGTAMIFELANGTGDVTGIINVNKAGGTVAGNLGLMTGSGNVGIGTTSPENKLTVVGDIGAMNGGNLRAYLSYNGSDAGVMGLRNSSNVDAVVLSASASSYFTGGNVGIGTTNPTEKLEVNGNIIASVTSGAARIKSISTDVTTGARMNVIADTGSLNLSALGSTTGGTTYGGVTGNNQMVFEAQGASSFYIGNSSAAPIIFAQARVEKVRIDNGGNVGIGTTNPTGKLEVFGTTYIHGGSAGAGRVVAIGDDSAYATIQGLANDYAVRDITLQNQGGNVGIGTTVPQGPLHVANGGGGRIILDAKDPTHVNWLLAEQTNINNGFEITPSTAVGGYTFSTPVFTALSSGNVGIGTTNPTATLQVAAASDSMALTVSSGSLNPFILYQNTVSDGNAEAVTNAVLSVGTRGGNSAIFRGNVGIGTTNPVAKLHIQTYDDGSVIPIYVTESAVSSSSKYFIALRSRDPGSPDNEFLFQTDGTALADGSWTGGGADYAEWMKKEGELKPGDAVGLNSETGKTRKYQNGDSFVGIYSTNPGFVGGRDNEKSEEEMAQSNALVALAGQVEFDSAQMQTVGDQVYTQDWKQVGSLLSDGKVLLEKNNLRGVVVNATGFVGIGTTAPAYTLDVGGGAGMNIRGYDVYTHDGAVTSFSDQRLKSVQGNFDRGLNEILALSPQYYHYKSSNPLGLASQETVIGLMAQDVQKLIPEAVQMSPSGYLTMSQGPIFYAMINAVKQQQGEISKQGTTISEQQNKITNYTLQITNQSNTLSDLQSAVNEKLSVIGKTLDAQEISINKAKTGLEDFEETLADYQTEANSLFASLIETDKLLTDRITSLEEKIATLSVSCSGETCPPAGEIPANVVTQDTQGNAALAGIFKAKDIQAETGSFKGALAADSVKAKEVESEGVVAGAFAVKTDAESAKTDTIGSGKILEVQKDEDEDGIDDETGGDGKSAVIKNSAVKKDSKIFVTSRTMLDQPLVVTKIKDGESFTVEKKSPTNQDIEFDWWIIGEK